MFTGARFVDPVIDRWFIEFSGARIELDTSRLRNAYQRYGPVPPNVYQAYGDQRVQYFEEYNRSALAQTNCLRDLHSFTGHVYSSGYWIHDYAEAVVCLCRKGGGKHARYSYADVISPKVKSAILGLPTFADAEAKREVTKYLTQRPDLD